MKTSHPSHASDFVIDYAVVAAPSSATGSGSATTEPEQIYRPRLSTYAAAAAPASVAPAHGLDVKPTVEQISIGISCDLKPIVYLDAETRQPRQRSVIIKQHSQHNQHHQQHHQQQQQHHYQQEQQQKALSKSAAAANSKRKRETGEFLYIFEISWENWEYAPYVYRSLLKV